MKKILSFIVMAFISITTTAQNNGTFNPDSPRDPGANYFNAQTGEAYFDLFEPGQFLLAAIELFQRDTDMMLQVKKITVASEMAENDISFIYFHNVQSIDLSQVSYWGAINDKAFAYLTALNTLALPEGVTAIYDGAFDYDRALEQIDCYATVPPTITANLFSAVNDKSRLTVRVPQSSIAAYKAAPGWKDLNIRPLDGVGGTGQLIVEMPQDVSFKNMYLELTDTGSGTQRRQLITADSHSFAALSIGTIYSLVVRNLLGSVMGKADDFVFNEDGQQITIQVTARPQTVTMNIQTPEGEDVTPLTTIVWQTANGITLGQGAILTGMAAGNNVCYTVTLDESLTARYQKVSTTAYSVKEAGNDLQIILTPQPVINPEPKDYKGSTAHLDITCHPSAEGAMGVLDIEDLQLDITRKATGETVSDFWVSYPQLYFEHTRFNANEEVTVKASSRNNRFRSAESTFTTDGDGDFDVNLEVSEWGLAVIQLSPTDIGTVVGTVYDGDGSYVAHFESQRQQVVVRGLTDGSYKVILMQKSQFFNSVATLDDLKQTTLREGSDYVATDISVTAGTTSHYTATVPTLDEEQLSHLASTTYLYALQTSVFVTSTATMKACVRMKNQYLDNVTDLRLVFDLPDHVRFIDGSLLTTQSNGSYELSGQRLIVPCRPGEQVKFCVIPEQPVDLVLTGIAEYTLNGTHYRQPFGTAQVEVEGIQLTVNAVTNTPAIHVSGNALPYRTLTLYDGDKKLREINVPGSGYFNTEVTLADAYDGTYHQIHGIVDAGGYDIPTESAVIYFDSAASIVTEGALIYQNQKTVWNYINHTLSPSYINIDPSESTVATLTAKMVNANINSIFDPHFLVTDGFGKVKRVKARWSESDQMYTAKTHFLATNNELPAEVDFAYDYAPDESVERTELYMAELNNMVAYHEELTRQLDEHLQWGEVTADTDDRAEIMFSLGEGSGNFKLSMVEERFDDVMALRQQETFIRITLDNDSLVSFTTGDDHSMKTYFLDLTNRQAFSIVIADDDADAKGTGLHKVSFLGVAKHLKDIGSIPLKIKNFVDKTAKDWKDLMMSKVYLDQMYSMRNLYNETLHEQVSNAKYLLLASCPDGENRVPDHLQASFHSQAKTAEDAAYTFMLQMDGLIESYEHALACRVGMEYGGAMAAAAAGAAVKGLVTVGAPVVTKVAQVAPRLGTASEIAGFIADGAKETLGQLGQKVSKLVPQDFMSAKKLFDKWAPDEFFKQSQQNLNLADAIKASYKECEEDEDEKDDDEEEGDEEVNEKEKRKRKQVTSLIDPSGFVYEGTTGNRLEGVTATVYYKAGADDDDATATMWDAAEYGQQNPQTTNADGLYMWNVPQGWWQVRFQKDGYEPTETAWLPVPPPQLDINVPMTSLAVPQVQSARADAQTVSLLFSKLMTIASLDGIIIRQNGQAVAGELVYDNSETLAQRIFFRPRQAFTAQTVEVEVPASAQSYAGIPMAADYRQELTVEHVIDGLAVEHEQAIEYGSSGIVKVWGYPAVAVAGKKLSVACASPIIGIEDGEVVFDSQGVASVPLQGLLPGRADVTFTIADITAVATVNVKHSIITTAARPVADIPSGSVVNKGTAVQLYSATENATIYYTTDGSCPCEEDGRTAYESPIVINADITIKAIAVCEGMADSDVTTLEYKVNDEVGVAPHVIPQEEVTETAYYSLNGIRLLPPLPKGTYVVVQRTPNGIVRRIVRL